MNEMSKPQAYTGRVTAVQVDGATGYVEAGSAKGNCSSLAAFMTEVSPIAQVCLLRGLISGLPTSVWLEPLWLHDEQPASSEAAACTATSMCRSLPAGSWQQDLVLAERGAFAACMLLGRRGL